MAKVIDRRNIAAVIREYEKDGEKKKVWRTIGEITTFEGDDGDKFTKCEIYHMPGVNLSVFKQEDKKDDF